MQGEKEVRCFPALSSQLTFSLNFKSYQKLTVKTVTHADKNQCNNTNQKREIMG